MIAIRNASDRGHLDHGWLNAYHTFSFGRYLDPDHMGFRALRVMNEDRIAPGKGFGTHGHDNMEIVTYVLSGALAHKDSMGHEAVLRPGEFQRISAGSGITHSEFNASNQEPVHLYQIWLEPNVRDIEPSYQQQAFAESDRQGKLLLVASPAGDAGSLSIRQDVRIYLAQQTETPIKVPLGPGRHAWLQVFSGDIKVNGHPLTTSDGAAISEETELHVEGSAGSEWMLFDLA